MNSNKLNLSLNYYFSYCVWTALIGLCDWISGNHDINLQATQTRVFLNSIIFLDPAVRDAAAEALGTATKLLGERNIAPHIGKLDNLKEQKIKEFADKVQFKFRNLFVFLVVMLLNKYHRFNITHCFYFDLQLNSLPTFTLFARFTFFSVSSISLPRSLHPSLTRFVPFHASPLRSVFTYF